jgi:phage host-nuclease inhibitor protein Gam
MRVNDRNEHHRSQPVQFTLSYSDIREFDLRLKAMADGIARLEERDAAELAALRAEVTRLVSEANMEQADKDALTKKLQAALTKSSTVEDKMRDGLPPNSP